MNDMRNRNNSDSNVSVDDSSNFFDFGGTPSLKLNQSSPKKSSGVDGERAYSRISGRDVTSVNNVSSRLKRINIIFSELSAETQNAIEALIDAEMLQRADRRGEPVLGDGINSVHLPLTAPRKWKNRLPTYVGTPADFCMAVYEPWLGKGLTRAKLRKLDIDLYQTLSTWLRRHPTNPKSLNLLALLPDRVTVSTQKIAKSFEGSEPTKEQIASARTHAARQLRHRTPS